VKRYFPLVRLPQSVAANDGEFTLKVASLVNGISSRCGHTRFESKHPFLPLHMGQAQWTSNTKEVTTIRPRDCTNQKP